MRISGKVFAQCGKWTNFLQGGQVSFTPVNFQHATKVFERLGAEIWVVTTTFNNRHFATGICVGLVSKSYLSYGLDSAHYYTCSHVSCVAFLKDIKARVEILTVRKSARQSPCERANEKAPAKERKKKPLRKSAWKSSTTRQIPNLKRLAVLFSLIGSIYQLCEKWATCFHNRESDGSHKLAFILVLKMNYSKPHV